jgi:hypothetical protein
LIIDCCSNFVLLQQIDSGRYKRKRNSVNVTLHRDRMVDERYYIWKCLHLGVRSSGCRRSRAATPTQWPNIVSSSPLVLSRSLSSSLEGCPPQRRPRSTVPPRRSSRRPDDGRLLHRAPIRLPVFLPLHGASCPPRLFAFLSLLPLPPTVAFSTGATRRGVLHRTCRGLLHRSGELYIGELHTPTSLHSQVSKRCCAKNACCKHMFQVF